MVDRVERHDAVLYVVPEAVGAGAYPPLPLSRLNVGELLNAVLSLSASIHNSGTVARGGLISNREIVYCLICDCC
jgi:hypothetical protein